MGALEQILTIVWQLLLGFIGVMIIIVLPVVVLLTRERKWGKACFLVGYYIIIAFFYVGLFALAIGKVELLPEIISSCVIAL